MGICALLSIGRRLLDSQLQIVQAIKELADSSTGVIQVLIPIQEIGVHLSKMIGKAESQNNRNQLYGEEHQQTPSSKDGRRPMLRRI
jgi:hypothetical protein